MSDQRINDPAELPTSHDEWLESAGLGYPEDLLDKEMEQ